MVTRRVSNYKKENLFPQGYPGSNPGLGVKNNHNNFYKPLRYSITMQKIPVSEYEEIKSRLEEFANSGNHPAATWHLDSIKQEEEKYPLRLCQSYLRKMCVINDMMQRSINHMRIYFQQNPHPSIKEIY